MPSLGSITPVILTFNEAANIGRTLSYLDWAREIVVVDSGSTDATVSICRADDRVRLFQRPFDTHAGQWNFAIGETGLTAPWVLALDADYIVTPKARAAMEAIEDDDAHDAFWCPIRYAVLGRTIHSGIYPPVRALFRRAKARYVQDGHTQRLVVDGASGTLRAWLVHDDRKNLAAWLAAQQRYARLEAEKLEGAAAGFRGVLRTRTPLAPFAVGLHCLVLKGGLLEGPPGWLYALQRMVAEALIAVMLLDRRLRGSHE